MTSSANITIRTATTADKAQWLELRKMLWPKTSEEKHVKEISEYLDNQERCALFAISDHSLMAFLEVSLRHEYVEGCATSPVAYLEGIFVKDEHRGKGVAKALIAQAEHWASGMDCLEIASDTEISNVDSINMHKQLGFSEVNCIVHFVKMIKK